MKKNKGPTRLPWSSILKIAVIGSIFGVSCGFLLPRRSVASVQLAFPGINSKLYSQLARALEGGDGQAADMSASIGQPSDSQVCRIAEIILLSRSATAKVMETCSLKPSLAWAGVDAVKLFQKQSLRVQVREPATLTVEVALSDAEMARSVCQAYLDYFSQYVEGHPLTQTVRAAKKTEKMIADVNDQLALMEAQLGYSSDPKWPQLGGGQTGPEASVVKAVWEKRLKQAAESRRVLDRLRRLRQEAGAATSDASSEGRLDESPYELWALRWGGARPKIVAESQTIANSTVKRSDLGARMKLERDYENALNLQRALILQQSFLTTWSHLESFQYEIVDPISVSRESYQSRLVVMGLGFGLLGGIVSWLAHLLRSGSEQD